MTKLNLREMIRATHDGNYIRVHRDDLEYLLMCLANQKFINELPPNGDAMALGKSEYDRIQQENQECIDSCYHAWIKVLHD